MPSPTAPIRSTRRSRRHGSRASSSSTAAGNRGSDADAVDYAPGNDPYAISVGAVDDQGTKQTKDDLRADWSSRGTTQDGYAKPDLYAPGARMVSNLAPGSDFASMCPGCVSGDGQYIRAGGTSMSAPVVAGIAATILEEHPSWTPDQVKGALANNLRSLPGGGHEVDALAAFNASKRELTSNVGLEPNEIVDPATGEVDWDKLAVEQVTVEPSRGWSRSRWSTATGMPERELGRCQLRLRLRRGRPRDRRDRPRQVAVEQVAVVQVALVHALVLLARDGKISSGFAAACP